MSEELAEVADAAIRRYSEIMTGTTKDVDVAALSQAVTDVTVKTYIVEQTEQFRVRAASEEEALTFVIDGSEDHVEWLACTSRTVIG